MWKKCKVVMLATNEKVEFFVANYIRTFKEKLMLNGYSQHLYILSDDEIKERDWCYHKDIGIVKCTKGGEWGEFCSKRVKRNFAMNDLLSKFYKVIATTDTSLRLSKPFETKNMGTLGNSLITLPKLPQSCITYYIAEYNKGNVITEVEVEYEESWLKDWETENKKRQGTWADEKLIKLKLSSDDTITVKSLKEFWTRDEVVKLLQAIAQDAISEPEIFVTGICFDNVKFTKWVESNL